MEKDLVNLHHSLRSSVDTEESAESSGTEGSSNPFAVSKHWCSWKCMNGTFLVLPFSREKQQLRFIVRSFLLAFVPVR